MGELQTIEKEYLPLLPPKLLTQYETLQKIQQTFKEDSVFNAAARMVRLLHVDYLKLLDALKANSPTSKFSIEKIFEHTPLMIPSKVPGKVYVFPNLIVDTVQKEDLRNVCWLICFDSLKSFNDVRAVKPKSWAPFFRGWRKVKKYEELSLIRALTRYTHIRSTFNYGEVCALEAAYLESIKPMELIYAEEPKDYITMFKSGGVGSCMTTSGSKLEMWNDILEQGHHPMSLFAYHPYIRGVYCVKGSSVVARTLLYKVDKKQWQYGRIHSINGIYNNKFAKVLQESGYEYLQNTFSREITVTVPGIYNKKFNDYLLPVPYMDNVADRLQGAFDPKTKEFTVSFQCTKGNRNISSTSTGGCIRASSLISIRCGNCNKACTEIHNSWDGKRVFCSSACASRAGYVYARTGEGELQLRITVSCYHDFLAPSLVFTNVNSCKKNGGKRVISEINEKDGKITAIQILPEQFSVNGYTVLYTEKEYCVDRSLYEYLKVNKLINNFEKLACSSKVVVKGVTK